MPHATLFLIPASDRTTGHLTTGNAGFYKTQLQDFLDKTPARPM